MPSIPRAIGVDQVPQLLASIDRRTAIGLRDYAILLLLARLGLRSDEVAKPIGVQGLATILGKWLPDRLSAPPVSRSKCARPRVRLCPPGKAPRRRRTAG